MGGYAYTIAHVSSGEHVISAPLPLAVVVYGYKAWNSYGYAAGNYAMFASDLPQPVATRSKVLHTVFPNPLLARGTIWFELMAPEHVGLVVCDVTGRSVRTLLDRSIEAGTHSVIWNGLDDLGRPAPAGIYLCRLRAGSVGAVRQMTLLR
jgi:hypothetical protein